MAHQGDRVAQVTGYDAEMVRLGLTGYLKTFRKPQCCASRRRLGSPQVLDDFVRVPKAGFQSLRPDVAVHVWAGNVPACACGV